MQIDFLGNQGNMLVRIFVLININKLFTRKKFIILIASKVRNLNDNYCKLFSNIKIKLPNRVKIG